LNIYLKLKELREYLKLTQVDFAKEIGISRATLSQIEIEKQKPTLDTIKKIAINYNIPYRYFFVDDSLIGGINHLQEEEKENKPPGLCPKCFDLNNTLKATEKALQHANGEIESRKDQISLLVDKVNYMADEIAKLKDAQPNEGQKRKSA
jgi:transcriptional regulator with XRE-family HTH domain